MLTSKWFRAFLVVTLCVGVSSGCRKTTPDVPPEEPVDDLIRTMPIYDQEPPMARADVGMEYTGPDGKFESVRFTYDSSMVSEQEMPKVQAIADFLNGNALTAVVEGNCDERGSDEYNMSLAERRADAVRANLVSLGVEANRLQTKSLGESNPVDPRHCESAWRQNRRVDFKLFN